MPGMARTSGKDNHSKVTGNMAMDINNKAITRAMGCTGKMPTIKATVSLELMLLMRSGSNVCAPGQHPGYQQQMPQGQQQTQQQQQFQRQPAQQQQQQQAQKAPTIAKRPDDTSVGTAPPKPVSITKEGGTKVLSIGGDAAAPKAAKVVSLTVPAAPKEESKPEEAKKDDAKNTPTTAEEGAKVTATKAIEKTGTEKSSSGKTSPTPSSGRSSPSRAGGPGKGAGRDADAVAKEQTADVDDDTLKEMYGKEHVNVVSATQYEMFPSNISFAKTYSISLVALPMLQPLIKNIPFNTSLQIFIGHVDAGKSTLGGAILYATGMVDQRTMDKYKREAKELGRESCKWQIPRAQMAFGV